MATTIACAQVRSAKTTIGLRTAKIELREFYIDHVENSAKNNAAEQFKSFISNNVNQYRDGYPLVLTINELNSTEKRTDAGVDENRVSLKLSFALKTVDDLSIPLGGYNTIMNYVRKSGDQAEKQRRMADIFGAAIRYTDNWIAINKNKRAALAKRVIFTFPDYKADAEDDTIYYSAKRPLTWADFKDKARGTKYAAYTIPALGYDQSVELKGGNLVVSITLKPSLAKSAAWVAYGQATAYNLNHEQRHFDIAQLAANWFKERLSGATFTPYNYEGEINVLYFDALREMDRLQKLYDRETSHGINTSEQARWNRYIDTELNGKFKQLTAY